MPRVVTYCRVSSDEQAEKDNSIPAQRKALRGWVAQNAGHELVEEFVDEGISAYAPADRRPGFCEMVSFCRKRDVDIILVHKLDRFSRNREESILFKGLLRKHGVQVKSVTEQFDPDSPQGFLYEGMIEVINQFYSMNLATETLKGMRENASRGWVNGGATPYGYARKQVTDAGGREHWTYELGDDAEVQVVRDIFRLSVEEAMGGRSIAAHLNTRGIPSPNGRQWNLSGVHNILNNPVYMGDLVWMKTRKKGRTGRVSTDEDERIVVQDAFPAIIDRETWEKRKALASKRTFAAHTSRHRPVNYLLGRMITCGHCGGSFVGRRREYTNRRGEKQVALAYYCSGYLYKGASVCKSLPIDMAWVEGVVVQALQARLVDADGWDELERRTRERIEARRRKYGLDPEAGQAKLDEIDRRIANYYRAIGGGLDPAVCKQLIDDLQEKKTALQAELETLATEDYYALALEKNLGLLATLRGHLAKGFERLPFGIQRELVLAFVKGIEVHARREVRIKLQVPLDNVGVQHLCDELVRGERRAEKAGSDGASTQDPHSRKTIGTRFDEAVGPYGQSGLGWLPVACRM